MPDQELSIFLREDVIRDHREVVVAAQQPAQREKQRGLAASDGAADADGERARTKVPGQRRMPVFERAGAFRLVRVRMLVIG